MNAVVKAVLPGSPASRTIIAPGDILRKINGKPIGDVLDYKYHSYESRLFLEFTGSGGRLKLVRLIKPQGADIGLEFTEFLMDKERFCANKCVFCFIDQLPDGMRKTLYYKDDDLRLSFLQGNYVTLTNLSRRDIQRIVEMRLQPINVSVHTTDPELRNYMLGTQKGAYGLGALKTLTSAGITVNCQIVCCPGINDGAELARTMKSLAALGTAVNSVSVVPVGLTKHRRGLTPLRAFDRETALKTVRQVETFGAMCLKRRGSRVFFCADELYMKAGLKLPPDRFYEDYPQLQNGVGMMRLFITEFEDALAKNRQKPSFSSFSIATGTAAARNLTNFLKRITQKYGKIYGMVYAVRNDFFGDGVTVSGLVTGADIIAQLRGRELGGRLLIPVNMLRAGETVFLDDVTVPELEEALGVTVRIVAQDGADFLRAVLGR